MYLYRRVCFNRTWGFIFAFFSVLHWILTVLSPHSISLSLVCVFFSYLHLHLPNCLSIKSSLADSRITVWKLNNVSGLTLSPTSRLKMGTGSVLKSWRIFIDWFNCVPREDFIEFCCRESFNTYTVNFTVSQCMLIHQVLFTPTHALFIQLCISLLSYIKIT